MRPSIESAGQPETNPPPEVFAVIPVFNRLAFTRACIECLRKQDYPRLRIVVVDGGSTDGTVDVLRRDYSGVTVLVSERELWWAGAMQAGIAHVLAQSQSAGDAVLMVNNDTLLPADYVSTLMAVAGREGAAVGALIVDSRDTQRVLDAGEYIDWPSYTFPVRTDTPPAGGFRDDVDVLPGRGSLVPLAMIRVAGNIDAQRFPHYIADYEFFCRLRRHGFRLGVTGAARLQAHIEETGIIPSAPRLSFKEFRDETFSRRSMGNIVDHWRFVSTCAPPQWRFRARRHLALGLLRGLLLRTPLRVVAWPTYRALYLTVWMSYRVLRFLVADSGPIEGDFVAAAGCDPDALVKAGILRATRLPGWYAFASKLPASLPPEVVQLRKAVFRPAHKYPAAWRYARLLQQRGEMP